MASLCLAAAACGGSQDGGVDPTLIHTVKRGDLRITVRERGELRAARDQRITADLEGRNTLIYLIPEGTIVQAGEKVAELDASEIEEKRTSEAISVAKAKASLDQARKNFEIMEKELAAAEKAAESTLQIARMRAEKLLGTPLTGTEPDDVGKNAEVLLKLRDLLATEAERHPETAQRHSGLVDEAAALLGSGANLGLKMGEMATQILQQINEVSLTRANLELSAQTLHYSRQLADSGFVTKNELDRDEINHQRAESEMTVSWNNLELLVHYTLPEAVISTTQDVENAELGLESVRAIGEARRVREQAELESAEAEYELAVQRLDNWSEQIEKAVLRAPGPGLVVYGRYDWDEPVYEGMEVRQRQEIVLLPDVSRMVTDLKVHEALIDKVASGQRAAVKVDAFPDRVFAGAVSHVSPLPDPAPSWRSGVKVYKVEVALDVDNTKGGLRPGMSGSIEVDVGVLRDILAVPVTALERRDDVHWVWKVVEGTRPQATPVLLGGNNLTHVEILAGLAEGDRIHLVRPPGAEVGEEELAELAERRPARPAEPPTAPVPVRQPEVTAEIPAESAAPAPGEGAGAGG